MARKERFVAKGKNRVRNLRTGETQRPDGLYVFSYVDRRGKQKHVYSWRLEESDYTPEGKREKPALRTLEAKIKCDLKDIDVQYMTVIDLVEKYIHIKAKSVRPATRTNHRFVVNVLKKDEYNNFCGRFIETVKTSMAKEFLQRLQLDGRGYSTIQSIRGVLRPAFQLALENDWIKKNPFEFKLLDIVVDDSVKGEAISPDQQRKYLEFIHNDKHFSKYYDAINIMFKTGLRISEFCGLTISDINFKEKKLTVCRQLHRSSDMTYFIGQPKTANGSRVLPLTDNVLASFQNLINNRTKPKREPIIKGVSGFLCLDKNDMPMVALHWEKYFQHILAKYNKTYKEELPKITPHICRHTYCTNMAKAGINPVYLAYLMGHRDKEITLNVYTTINENNSFDAIRDAVLSTTDTITNNPYFKSVLY